MNIEKMNLSIDEYRHIVEPYIIERLQTGFTDPQYEIDISRFASLYGYPVAYAQKHLGYLIRNLANKAVPDIPMFKDEQSKPWIQSYEHKIEDNIYVLNFNKQLSKLIFSAFKRQFVEQRPSMSLVAG